MDTITQVAGLVIISMLSTIIYAPFLIKLLYKFHIVVRHKLMPDKSNAEFMKTQSGKSGTPTLGGLMISISVFVLTLLIVPFSPLKSLFLAFWFVFTMYGLIEGLYVYGRKLSVRLRQLESSFGFRLFKLGVLFTLCLLVVSLTTNVLGITSLDIFGLTIAVNLLSIVIGSGCFVFAVYAMEITDGADGLVTGQFIIAMISYIVITVLTGHKDIVPILALMLGSSVVYLYFNINPARVFMGGTGTFPIAFALLFFSIITNTVDIFFIMGMVFWVEVTTSFLQIFWIRFLHKKLFKIAPIHHYFQAIGWEETKMVQRFWLASAVFAIIALFVFGSIK